MRVVRSPQGALSIDLRGKVSGRGAYVCADEACVTRGLGDGALARALESPIDSERATALGAELAQAVRERRRTNRGG